MGQVVALPFEGDVRVQALGGRRAVSRGIAAWDKGAVVKTGRHRERVSSCPKQKA